MKTYKLIKYGDRSFALLEILSYFKSKIYFFAAYAFIKRVVVSKIFDKWDKKIRVLTNVSETDSVDRRGVWLLKNYIKLEALIFLFFFCFILCDTCILSVISNSRKLKAQNNLKKKKKKEFLFFSSLSTLSKYLRT